jgi:hypothetical protein
MIDSWSMLFPYLQVSIAFLDSSFFRTITQLSVYWIATAIVHIAFAISVLADAKQIRNTFLVKGYIWALATLLGGEFVVVIYWVIHHSNLRSQDRQVM